ncbi:MAG: hypothetical protein RSB69_07955 [Odoribacter sp.]
MECVGVGVEARIEVCHSLGVGLKEVGIDELEMVGFDLFPAEGGAILTEVDELRGGGEGSEEEDGEEEELTEFHKRVVRGLTAGAVVVVMG